MKYSKNIIMSLAILFPFITLRIVLNIFTDDVCISIMAVINSIALAFVFVSIFVKTHTMMQETQNEISKGKISTISDNSEMKCFRRTVYIFSAIMIILIPIYVWCFRSNIINDILTIIALVFSIQDNSYANILFRLYYKSYYGNSVQNYLNNIT